MDLEKINMREFRNNIAKYLSTKNLVAVTRHGQIIGYFVPTKADEIDLEFENLKVLANRLNNLLKEKGISEDDLVEDFKKLRMEGGGE